MCVAYLNYISQLYVFEKTLVADIEVQFLNNKNELLWMTYYVNCPYFETILPWSLQIYR